MTVAGHISLRGVAVHNLKSVDLDIPHRKLVVFCGLSGSGKSSLALDTLYAEGQRRYIESFSAYTRQFLDRLEKPEAERIDGLPPAIAVTGGGSSRSSRSTVGTTTEVADYLRLLFAKIGTSFAAVREDGPPRHAGKRRRAAGRSARGHALHGGVRAGIAREPLAAVAAGCGRGFCQGHRRRPDGGVWMREARLSKTDRQTSSRGEPMGGPIYRRRRSPHLRRHQRKNACETHWKPPSPREAENALRSSKSAGHPRRGDESINRRPRMAAVGVQQRLRLRGLQYRIPAA